MDEHGACSHKVDYVTVFWRNPEGHPNRITDSRVTAILLNGLILPIGHQSFSIVYLCNIFLDGPNSGKKINYFSKQKLNLNSKKDTLTCGNVSL